MATEAAGCDPAPWVAVWFEDLLGAEVEVEDLLGAWAEVEVEDLLGVGDAAAWAAEGSFWLEVALDVSREAREAETPLLPDPLCAELAEVADPLLRLVLLEVALLCAVLRPLPWVEAWTSQPALQIKQDPANADSVHRPATDQVFDEVMQG